MNTDQRVLAKMSELCRLVRGARARPRGGVRRARASIARMRRATRRHRDQHGCVRDLARSRVHHCTVSVRLNDFRP